MPSRSLRIFLRMKEAATAANFVDASALAASSNCSAVHDALALEHALNSSARCILLAPVRFNLTATLLVFSNVTMQPQLNNDGVLPVLDGRGRVRVLHVLPPAHAMLHKIHITGGLARAERLSVVGWSGGGLLNEGDTVLTECALYANSAAIAGGGVMNLGTIRMEACVLSGNSAISTESSETRLPPAISDLIGRGTGSGPADLEEPAGSMLRRAFPPVAAATSPGCGFVRNFFLRRLAAGGGLLNLGDVRCADRTCHR
jgi:hypothetical protein